MLRSLTTNPALAAALLLLAPELLWAQTGDRAARALSVETRAHRSFADAGESGPGFDVSARISVLVTRDGQPVDDLGDSVPMDGGEITLPPAWTLETSFVAPVGPVGIGCVLSPTQFQNRGHGIYVIRVVPLLGNPICRWGLGDYHYVVRLSRGTSAGSGLGVLTVPDTPSVP